MLVAIETKLILKTSDSFNPKFKLHGGDGELIAGGATSTALFGLAANTSRCAGGRIINIIARAIALGYGGEVAWRGHRS